MRAIVPLHDGFHAGDPVGLDWTDLDRFAAPREIAVPEPGRGQVLVHVGRAAVNPSDLHYLAGEYGLPRRSATAAGFEGMGRVVAAGPGLSGLYGRTLVGRRVAFGVGPTGTGAWADYAVTEAAAAIPVGDAIRDKDAAALLVNPFTAWAMIDEVARRHAGRASKGRVPAVVLTAGASQLARLALALARERELPVICVVRRVEQRDELLGEGASEVLVTTAPDYAERRAEAFGRLRPLTLLDAVADEASSDLAAGLGRGGRWIVYGGLSASRPPGLNPLDAIFRGKRQEGFWLSDWIRRAPLHRRIACVRSVRARFADGRWRTRVSATVLLDRAMEELLPAPREGGKVQIAVA